MGTSRVQSCPDIAKVRDRTCLLRNGFPLLLAIGVIDSATRMGFLTFLPFLLQAKGAGVPQIGLALTLLFAGGAAGKLVCGFLGARLGVLPTVLLGARFSPTQLAVIHRTARIQIARTRETDA